MTDFLTALQTWFYRGSSDMIHDEAGLDAFDAWINQYETAPREHSETDELPQIWSNSGSVALNVYETDGGTLAQQDTQYAWLIPLDALDTMPTVAPSRPPTFPPSHLPTVA